MAKKKATRRRGGVSKSQAIRDYKTAHPEAGPKAIAEALNQEQGLSVSAAHVSTVLSDDRRKKGGVKKRTGRPAGNKQAGREPSMGAILQAKQLAERMGGVEKARAALEAYAKVVE